MPLSSSPIRGRELATGIYFYRLETPGCQGAGRPGYRAVKKVVVMR